MNTIERYGTVLRIYDNGGKTMDRYTILPPRWDKEHRMPDGDWLALYSGTDPKGMSGHVECAAGSHLGKRIHWDDLPEAVQRIATDEYPNYP